MDRVASTNTALRERVQGGEALPSGFVLAAREQTAGRGRFDREWLAAPGRDLTFSFLLRWGDAMPQAASLPMAAALGVTDLLRKLGVDARVKWPNDVLVGERKIAGLLAETVSSRAGMTGGAVVGIGLNVNAAASDLAVVGRPATSLRVESGREWAPEALLPRLLRCMAPRLDRWLADGFEGLRTDWERRAAWMGATVSIHRGADIVTGILAGFGGSGELLLRHPDGAVEAVWSGDTLRPGSP